VNGLALALATLAMIAVMLLLIFALAWVCRDYPDDWVPPSEEEAERFL
jgi:hypothetical protein